MATPVVRALQLTVPWWPEMVTFPLPWLMLAVWTLPVSCMLAAIGRQTLYLGDDALDTVVSLNGPVSFAGFLVQANGGVLATSTPGAQEGPCGKCHEWHS